MNPKYVSPAALRGLKKVKSAEIHVSNIKKEKASKRRSIKLTPTPGPLENIFAYNEEVVRNRESKKRKISQNSSEIENTAESEISEGDSFMNESGYDEDEDDGENADNESDDSQE